MTNLIDSITRDTFADALAQASGEPIARHTGVVGVEQLVEALDGIAAATPAAGAAS